MREIVERAASVENVTSVHNRLQCRLNHKLNLVTILWHILQDQGFIQPFVSGGRGGSMKLRRDHRVAEAQSG